MASAMNTYDQNARETSTVTVEVAIYDATYGIGTWWDDRTVLRAEVWEKPERTVVISGNPAGLTSLARHLLTLAQEAVPDGSHFDFDTYLGYLDERSVAIRLEIEKGARTTNPSLGG